MLRDSEKLALPFGKPAVTETTLEPISVRIADAIRLTGIRRSKLYELIASGDLETVKIGRCTLVPVASLHALIERARQGLL
ncbi:helix-turn-helix domain-containing protein [Sphingobium salicis]|nr:helix-turn-helix domain-containing protein [Sphingobium sp.]